MIYNGPITLTVVIAAVAIMYGIIEYIKILRNRKYRKKKYRRTWLERFSELPKNEKIKVLTKWMDEDELDEWYCRNFCFHNRSDDCEISDCLEMSKEEMVKLLIESNYMGGAL